MALDQVVPPLSAAQRRDRIRRDLEATGFISVRALTEELGVSDMTIRRDLRRLEAEGTLRIVHGGASLPTPSDYRQRGMSERAAKAAIGEYAAGMLPAGSTVLMDAGTTVAQIVRYLASDYEGYVITHSVPVIETMLARPGTPVHCLGGELRPESRAMIGPTTVEQLQKVSAEVLFLGAAAISERGVFVAKDLERGTKTAFIRASRRVILVVDHTKFGKFSPVLLAPLDVIDEIVTDRQPPAELARLVDSLGIKGHLAS